MKYTAKEDGCKKTGAQQGMDKFSEKVLNGNRAVEPSDVEGYPIAEDGGLIYNPISREKGRLGQLNKYDMAKKVSGRVECDGTVLEYSFPEQMTAYDAVPVHYKLTAPKDAELPVHLSVTAFEDTKRSGGKTYYDLNLPGKVEVQYEYLGYVGGTFKKGARPQLSGDFNDVLGTQYPHFDTTELRRSGTIQSTDITWFKFRYKNTGDTILDNDGNGAFQFTPMLMKMDDKGEYQEYANYENLFYRLFDELYPGETGEVYMTVGPNYLPRPFPAASRKLPAGKYRFVIFGSVRNELDKPDAYRLAWDGTYYTTSYFDFDVAEEDIRTEPGSFVLGEIENFEGLDTVNIPSLGKEGYCYGCRNKWLHYYEEFLSSYLSFGKLDNGSAEGTLYIQPAPWTTSLSLKLMHGAKLDMLGVRVPVQVERDSLSLSLRPDHSAFVVKEDGTRAPAITTQTMCDMRGNIQLTPDASNFIINTFLDMQECGVNYFTSTIAFAFDCNNDDMKSCINVDSFKFGADVMRKMGIPLEGFAGYPYKQPPERIKLYTGRESKVTDREGFGDQELSVDAGICAKYAFDRYGDNYFQLADGTVPICTEDTRGWMRFDLQVREELGNITKQNFRTWLKGKYGTIEAVNAAWGSSYQSFEEIDPEVRGGELPKQHNHRYMDRGEVFCDFNQAVCDLDTFRTLEKIENYEVLLAQLKDVLPEGKMMLRTEGGNYIVKGLDPNSKEPAIRHAYYSQRRAGIVADLMIDSGLLCAAADYTTLPYTPAQVERLTRMSVEQGVMPCHLPQFNRMRDIAINSKYGFDDYTLAYNLKTPQKGVFLGTLVSLYEWWKAVMEAGGTPGLLWQDYLCDGMVNKTQFLEMKFFMKKLNEYLATEEGQKWSRDFTAPDRSFQKRSLGRYSYPEEYIEAQIERAKQNRKHPFCREQSNKEGI